MNFATTSFMPLLSRVVIAAAMLTSGWVNCFSQIQIRDEIASGLQAMEIEVHEIVNQEDQGDVEVSSEEASTAVPVQAKHTSLGVNRIVWMVHERWPDLGGWGTLLAWCAAISQLLAGILLIFGLFTRYAAFAICLATGMAVFLVSIKTHGMFAMNPFDWPLDSHRFIQLFAGLGLFTLSLGLLFGGAGGMSLDQRYRCGAPEKKTKHAKNSTE